MRHRLQSRKSAHAYFTCRCSGDLRICWLGLVDSRSTAYNRTWGRLEVTRYERQRQVVEKDPCDWPFLKERYCCLEETVVDAVVGRGPDLPSAGPCSEKNVGLFTPKKLATFLVITVRVSAVSSREKLATFFCSLLSLFSSGCPLFRYFGHAKSSPLFLWGPFFVGAPVRPNILNMPKSAAQ